MSKKIQETAFLTVSCRAANETLSQDPFAKYWLNTTVKELHNRYIEKVSATENITLALRNSFFLEKISSFFKDNPSAVLVNIGAGYSSYPYLLPENRRYAEVDLKEVIEHKQSAITKFIKEGKFPKRKVTYFDADLKSSVDLKGLFDSLSKWIGKDPSFILFEGVLYYLNYESIESLFEMVRSLQQDGSRLGAVTWSEKTVKNPIFQLFLKFMKETPVEEMYIFHDQKKISQLKGYMLMIQTDYCQLCKAADLSKQFAEEELFWEDIFLLERVK